jgi:DNA helicase-2/ATP-dependent DNA helicase PcrA
VWQIVRVAAVQARTIRNEADIHLMSYLERLNPEQREAAEHFEGPLLVLAGAGSGKTRVLTSRIAHLIEEYGVAPESILALTFTNKAAAEMRERVRGLLGREPSGMWIGTFHAIGARMLRRDATRLGWTPSFIIYDADDSERLVRRILKDELGLDPRRWSPRSVRGSISSAKNELVAPEEYAARAFDPYSKTVARVYESYERALLAANAFDFDDLLVRPVETLRRFPDVLNRYRRRFRFVLVDEYQDTNRAQYEFLKLIASTSQADEPDTGGNLFVVGDDDQSIYGWRGADVRNILEFEKDFPDAGTVRLEQNYRSTQRILEAANRVIAENSRRKGKTLRTANPAGEAITLLEASDEVDEAEWIVTEVRARLGSDTGRTPRDFVVLYRTNAQSRALEEAFRREGIPYRIVGGQRFYERREVKDVLAYLRLIANPADDEAFLRIVNVPRRGIGDASIVRLGEYARASGLPLLAAAETASGVPDLRGGAPRALERFAALVRKFALIADSGARLDDLLRQIVDETGFEKALADEGPDGEDRIANVEELIASASELQARAESGDPDLDSEIAADSDIRPLDLFLAHVALVTDIDQSDPQAAVVSLMTMHNAKGLEYPIVFLSGLEEGLFPLSHARDERDDIEEERRLFYVGITRAEEKLYLSTARRRRRGGEWMDSVPSSFLESIPPDLLERRRTRRAMDAGRSSASYAARFQESTRRGRLGLTEGVARPAGQTVDYTDTQESIRLVKGTRVRHPQFGSGTVLELSGFGADVRATIDFESVGRKTVVVRYARLEPDWD